MTDHLIFQIVVAATTTVSVIGAVAWAIASRHLVAIRRDPPSIRRGERLPPPNGGWPKVSVVIPAHDEERVIDRCARSLRAVEYPDYEVIFVLDRCTDATAEILAPHAAADPCIRVIENDHCPDDWAGKCHAASLGAAAATGDVLIFTDADVAFDPGLMRAGVAIANDDSRQLISLLSTLTTEHLFERISQPVASMQLLHQYPIDRINRRRRPRPFANGQFLLFDRATYDRIGGHAAVKDDLLEDIAFARAVQEAGGSGAVFFADGMLRVSMYPTWEAFRRGWKRIFIEAASRSPRRLRKYAMRLMILGVAIPVAQLATLVAAAMLAVADAPAVALFLALPVLAGVGLQRWTLRQTYKLAGADPRDARWWSLGCWRVSRIMREAASDLVARRPVRWGGREYVLEPTD